MQDSQTKEKLIGDVANIVNSGKGLLFSVVENTEESGGETKVIKIPAFAIRYNDKVHAFLNRCGHIAVTLDFQPGNFFSEEGDTLVCATHGANYAPDTGKCLGGPCFGVGLEPLNTRVEDGKLYLNEESFSLVCE